MGAGNLSSGEIEDSGNDKGGAIDEEKGMCNCTGFTGTV